MQYKFPISYGLLPIYYIGMPNTERIKVVGQFVCDYCY